MQAASPQHRHIEEVMKYLDSVEKEGFASATKLLARSTGPEAVTGALKRFLDLSDRTYKIAAMVEWLTDEMRAY